MVAIEVGPYSFSVTDARRTLAHAIGLLDLVLVQSGHPDAVRSAQAARRDTLAALLTGVDPDRDPPEAVASVLQELWPLLLAAGDDLATAGDLPPPATGLVRNLAVSTGGVPKQSVGRVDVGFGGVLGDRQATRAHHGRPWQALCVWSSEVLADLAAEGHPIAPGAAGENITVEGLPWREVRPGTTLGIGSARCVVTAFAVPCSQNARWFADRRFDRIHHSNGPLSRVYAVVTQPGSVTVGDPAVLQPA